MTVLPEPKTWRIDINKNIEVHLTIAYEGDPGPVNLTAELYTDAFKMDIMAKHLLDNGIKGGEYVGETHASFEDSGECVAWHWRHSGTRDAIIQSEILIKDIKRVLNV